MESYNDIDIFRAFCEQNKKYGIYVSYDTREFSMGDIKQVIPFLSTSDYLWSRGLYLFDDKKERDEHFKQISGIDESIGSKFNNDCRLYAKMIN